MKKYHVHTTISQKHWDLLAKHKQKFETKQKVIENALESLDISTRHVQPRSPEEELWMQIGRYDKDACLTQRDGLKILMETIDFNILQEYIDHQKPIEFAIECYLQKPLKDCSLGEVVDALAVNARTSNWPDSVNCTDDGEYYTLKMTHSMGYNTSKMFKMFNDSVFKTYGAKIESTISSKTFFLKIFKN